MELELSREEAEQVLLEWAQAKFPAAFNKCEIEGYSSRAVKFSHEKKEEEEK